MKKKIKLLLSFFLWAALILAVGSLPRRVQAVDCDNTATNLSINGDCSFPGTTDGVDAGTGSTNTATITINSGILTVNSNQSIGFGTLTLSGGSVALATGGQLRPGMPLWMVDSDADGYPASLTQYLQSSAPAGGRRRNLITSLTTVDCNDNSYSDTNTCTFYRAITISYSGSTLSNFDVLIQLDTASLISAGKMQSDCGDIRMYDSDHTTGLNYWIEGGCNTSSTQIWTRVPSIPDGGKTIYMDYGDLNLANGTLSWSGQFTLLRDSACPSGWTRLTALDSRFPRGASSYGGTGGSSAAHNHGGSFTANTGQANYAQWLAARCGTDRVDYRWHSHNFTVYLGSTSILPSYRNMVFCSKADLVIPSGMISMFTTSAPSGWTRFTALDGRFPRGASSYGGTGGSDTHTHTASADAFTVDDPTNIGDVCGGSAYVAAPGHRHAVTINANTNAGSSLPAYLNMVFAKANSQSTGKPLMVAIVNSLPPLGWTRWSALDGKFPRGASSYGGTGGSDTHTHTIGVSYGKADGWRKKKGDASKTQRPSSHSDHQHPDGTTITTPADNNVPPYLNVIFARRNNPVATTSVGAEQSL